MKKKAIKTKKVKKINSQIWFCKDCNFEFSSPENDKKTQFGRCPYCHSDRITPVDTIKRPVL